MLKPFAPVYYERCKCDNQRDEHYDYGDGMAVWWADDRAYEKRLGDAELAAEYWRAQWSFELVVMGVEPPEELSDPVLTIEGAADRVRKMHRFATLPHFRDEPNWQDDTD